MAIKWETVRGLAYGQGARPETVKKWRQRGIPPAWVLKLLSAARAAGLTEDDLLELSSLSTTSDRKARFCAMAGGPEQ